MKWNAAGIGYYVGSVNRERPEEARYWRYELRGAGTLNARSERTVFEGALIRVDGGYGCLHPWPELGDPALDDLLQMMRTGEDHVLIDRARCCAAMDRAARLEARSLFKGLTVPTSHATLVEWSAAAVEAAMRAGFGVMKLKAGRDIAREAGMLNEYSHAWPDLRWRLDFNARTSVEDICVFLECLRDSTKEQIDFLEDPCPFVEEHWLALREVGGLRLAMDRGASPGRDEADVLVLKPALVDPRDFRQSAEENAQWLVVTSAMDHPVGQCFAAYEAARLSAGVTGMVGECGLQTHGLFETDAFSERLGVVGPVFHPPGGSGLGFDDLLEGLPWKPLS